MRYLRWEHRREVPEDIDEYVFNNLWQNNRNLAIYGSFIIDTSVDDHVFALDAGTGRLSWETKILDYRENPAMQSSGPIVADGKVISGRSCMPAAGPDGCVITAHAAQTGAVHQPDAGAAPERRQQPLRVRLALAWPTRAPRSSGPGRTAGRAGVGVD